MCRSAGAFCGAVAGILALAALAISGPAWALDKVTFGTNWLAEAEHGGYYQARRRRHLREVRPRRHHHAGRPAGQPAPLLLAGKIDFYMGGNMLRPFDAVQQNIPMRVVAAIFQKEPQVLMSHPGRASTSCEDLEEADQYFIGDEGAQTFFLWMKTELRLRATTKRMPYTFNPAPFIANKKSVQQGYVTSEPFAVEKEGGFEPNVFLLADYGFDTYSTTIEAMQDTIDKKPDVVQCFVDGSTKGWYNYLYGDNKAANERSRRTIRT